MLGGSPALARREIDRPVATSVRWYIMSLVVATSVLTYLDRLNLSIAGKYIQDEFAIPVRTMGWIFSAFLLGYALFQIPGGYAADRFGPRRLFVVVITSWSVLTAATAIAPRLPLVHWFGLAWSFAIVRFLIGIGEAPSSPGYATVVAAWMGDGHRGVGSSFSMLGIGLGGAFTPIFIASVMQHWGWRASFYISGALGLLIAMAWYYFATDQPESHPSVNPAELELIRRGGKAPRAHREDTPWGKMLSNRSVIALVLGYFCQGFPIYFYHTWFFIYLVRVRGFSLIQGGFWAACPYLAIAILSPSGGWFSDFAVRRMGRRLGRKTAVWLGMSGSAVLLWSGGQTPNKFAAIAMLAVAAGLNMFAAATFWAACIDLSQKHSGSLSGLMNTLGNLGGWLSPIVTAYVATRFGWSRALALAALVTLGSGFCWLFVDAGRGIDEPSASA